MTNDIDRPEVVTEARAKAWLLDRGEYPRLINEDAYILECAIASMADFAESETAALRERLHKADGMANEVNILTTENKRLTAERDRLKAGLEHYADELNWDYYGDSLTIYRYGRVNEVPGPKVAQEALKQDSGK